MAAKVNQSRHWAHISAGPAYDIPARALPPEDAAAQDARLHALFRDTDSARGRRGQGRPEDTLRAIPRGAETRTRLTKYPAATTHVIYHIILLAELPFIVAWIL